MSANLNTPAAIPSKAIRAARGRFMAEAQAGAVGAWDWSPAPAGETFAGATLVKVHNSGTNDIKRWEACCVPDAESSTEFFHDTYR